MLWDPGILQNSFTGCVPVTNKPMLGAALVHIASLEQQLVAGQCPQSDVAVALNRLTSKVPEALRAKEALEANNAAVSVGDLRAAYTRVAEGHRNLNQKLQKD